MLCALLMDFVLKLVFDLKPARLKSNISLVVRLSTPNVACGFESETKLRTDLTFEPLSGDEELTSSTFVFDVFTMS